MPRKPSRPPPDPRRAVAYLRASTDLQDYSQGAQREAIDAWARGAGVEIASWHSDRGVSGGAEPDRRPGLMAALDALPAEGAGILVVARRDRLARDVFTDALVQRLCERQGAVVRSADGVANGDRPEDQLMRSIMSAMAAYERALIRSRTKAALAVKKARGERVGEVPLGWRVGDDGKLVEDAKEQAAIALARQLHEEGQSLRGIADALVEAGHAPRTGRKSHVQVVARVVAN